MNIKIKSSLGLLTILICSICQAETIIPFKDLVEKVISNNPEIQARYHNYLAAEYEQDAAKGGFLPRADITSTYRKQENINSGRNSNGSAIPRMNNQLILRQMIFDGFATRSEVNRLGHTQRVRYYELQSAMQEGALEFTRAYVDTLRFQQLYEFAKQNYVVHKQLHERIKERVEAGVARKVDLEQASGRLALAEANLLTEATNLHDVNARMQRLLGELPPQTLETLTFINAGTEPSVQEALKVAYLKNPTILSSVEDIQAVNDEIKTKEARYLPKVDLQARKNLGTSYDGRNSTNAADVLEVTMNFNLFNGLSDKNLVSQVKEKLNSANDMRDKACIDTRQQVAVAYNDINALKEQQGYRQIHQKSIENAREAYRKQFDIGQRTFLDLLDTENEYFQTNRSLANTQYDLQTAYARLFASQGELLNKIGSVRQGLPEMDRAAYADALNVCEAIAPQTTLIDKASILASAAAYVSDKPIINSTTPMQSATCNTESIATHVNNWASAWRHKDYDNYVKFYSENFKPEQGLSLETWRTHKKQILTTAGKINLELGKLEISCVGDKAVAKFNQDYSVTKYKLQKSKDDAGCQVCNAKRVAVTGPTDRDSKQLDFAKQNGEWKIIKELSTKRP